MALTRPVSVDAVEPVTPKAEELALHLASIDLTKFRFKMGCALIAVGIFVFFVGHFMPLTRYFTPSFTADSWHLTIGLLVLGAAFAGKEVAEGLSLGLQSIFGKRA